jgi:hypothetical protein
MHGGDAGAPAGGVFAREAVATGNHSLPQSTGWKGDWEKKINM